MKLDRDKWRGQMVGNRFASNGTKLLLVILADHMDSRGRVSVSRSKLAEILQVAPTRITERIREAHDVGLLTTIVNGRPGTTAVYAATYSVGTPIRTKRSRVRDAHMVGMQYQAEVHPSVPSAHAQLGTPVHSASSKTSPKRKSIAATGRGEKPKRSEANSKGAETAGTTTGECATCLDIAALDDTKQCRRCAKAWAVA